jgi:hypothetical protein
MSCYAFTFLNHLGEGFGTRSQPCRDEQDAREVGQALVPLGYPVMISRAGTQLAILYPDRSELVAWAQALARKVI